MLKTNQPKAKTTQPMRKIHYLNIALLTATLFVRNQANAAIDYSEIQNVAYSQGNVPGAFSLFNAPGNWDDIRLDVDVDEDPSSGNRYEFTSMLNVQGNYVEFAVGSDPSDIKKFSSGATIDSSSVWGGNFYEYFSSFYENFELQFTAEDGDFRNTTGYAGMRLTDGANVYYGWIQVSVNNFNNSGITGTLIDWAYDNTPGQGIQAAAVPEPSTAGLLFGAVAIYCLVRRRRK
jgi:hypothetical protein